MMCCVCYVMKKFSLLGVVYLLSVCSVGDGSSILFGNCCKGFTGAEMGGSQVGDQSYINTSNLSGNGINQNFPFQEPNIDNSDCGVFESLIDGQYIKELLFGRKEYDYEKVRETILKCMKVLKNNYKRMYTNNGHTECEVKIPGCEYYGGKIRGFSENDEVISISKRDEFLNPCGFCLSYNKKDGSMFYGVVRGDDKSGVEFTRKSYGFVSLKKGERIEWFIKGHDVIYKKNENSGKLNYLKVSPNDELDNGVSIYTEMDGRMTDGQFLEYSEQLGHDIDINKVSGSKIIEFCRGLIVGFFFDSNKSLVGLFVRDRPREVCGTIYTFGDCCCVFNDFVSGIVAKSAQKPIYGAFKDQCVLSLSNLSGIPSKLCMCAKGSTSDIGFISRFVDYKGRVDFSHEELNLSVRGDIRLNYFDAQKKEKIVDSKICSGSCVFEIGLQGDAYDEEIRAFKCFADWGRVSAMYFPSFFIRFCEGGGVKFNDYDVLFMGDIVSFTRQCSDKRLELVFEKNMCLRSVYGWSDKFVGLLTYKDGKQVDYISSVSEEKDLEKCKNKDIFFKEFNVGQEINNVLVFSKNLIECEYVKVLSGSYENVKKLSDKDDDNDVNKIKDDVYYANRLIWERMQKVNEMTQWRKNSNKKLLCGTSVECEKNEFNLEKEVNIITSLKDFYNTKTGKKMCFTTGGMKKYKHNFDEILYDRSSFLDIPNYILCKQWNDIYKDAADRKVIDNLFACLAKISHVKLFMHPKAHGGKLKSTNIWHMAINDKYRLKYKYINNESCMDKKINPDYIKFNDNVKYGIVEIVGNIEHT